MKKLLVIPALIIAFGLIACAGAALADTPAEGVIGTVLTDYRMMFTETKDTLIANGGENINVEEGNGVKTITDEGVMFSIGKNENTFFNTTRITEAADYPNMNQAIHIKFKTTTDKFEIGLWGDFGIVTTMNEEQDRRLCLHAPEYAISTPYTGDLQILHDHWYHLLTAVDADGVFQGAVWEDGDEAHPAYTNQAFGTSFNERRYQNQHWEPSIQIWGEATFTIESYAYYTFEGFVKEGIPVELNNGIRP